MEAFIGAVQAYGVPTVVILLGIAAVVVAAGVTMARPIMMTLAFVFVLCVESGSAYGLDVVTQPIYSRGSGKLPLTFWQIGMIGALLWSVMSARLQDPLGPHAPLVPRPSFVPWAWAFFVLLVAHLLVGLMLGVDHEVILWAYGFSEMVWMSIIAALVVTTVRTAEDLDRLLKFIVLVALARAAYGLARFAFAGGDPMNIYATDGGVAKLTFFDIPDSLVATLAAVIALYRLLADRVRTVGVWRLVYAATAMLCVANVLFSYRRSAWVGLLLALAVLLVFLPRRRRWQFAVLAVPVVLAGIGYTAYQRLDRFSHNGNFLQMFLFDMISPEVGRESERTLELRLAWETFLRHPLLGTGAWGTYSNATLIDWQTGERAGAFLHSGPLHLALKTGLLGLALFAGYVLAIGRACWRAARIEDPDTRAAAVAGIAGILFALVDFLIAPPYNRMQELTGVCLALPYVALVVSASLPAPVRVASSLADVAAENRRAARHRPSRLGAPRPSLARY